MRFARLRAWTRRLPRARPCGVVLCYHRVASLERDPQLLAVTPEHFAEQLAYLSDHSEPVPLEEIFRPERSALPRVAVTFDDGYADNLIVAKPLLEEQRVPATIFICTGNLGTRREFWWDELERIVLEPETLPGRLETTVGQSRVVCDLGDGSISAPAWNVLDRSDPSPRHGLYRELASLIRPLSAGARDAALAELRTWAGLGEVGRESHRSLTKPEVATLAASPWVEIGAHTVSHPVLSSLAAQAQRREIETSRNVLKELTGKSVDAFAYPYGGASDYSRTTVRILQETAATIACTTEPNAVTERINLLRIPRILVRDWDAGELRQRLEPFLPG
jgi:peptidoglycan/xylan/chitin deacetylase (PgdA/CDA1 family)